jgi:hypothetical protein
VDSAEQPSGDLYALGCFHPSVGHSSGDHGDQEPWAFDEDIIDITRKFVNGISCYHIYIPCFGNILKKNSMLKPYYDK